VSAGSPEIYFQPLKHLPAIKNQYGRKKWSGPDRAAKVGPVDKYVIAVGDTSHAKPRFCSVEQSIQTAKDSVSRNPRNLGTREFESV
jgi:hypothetical protein